MGYLVESSGRLLLPEPLEPQVLTVLEVDLLRHQGWFGEEDVEVVDTLADLARFVGADLVRDGDWLVVSTYEEGDPKWSEQATAFYEGLARWVLKGDVRLAGEDGAQWSYRYGPDGMVKEGVNGWDSSPGDDVPEPAVPPAPPAPAPSSLDAPASPPVEPDARDAGPAHDFWADDPSPRQGNRTVAMTLLLLVGVALIVGVAMLAAGMVG
jgi:hypothetical protein